MLEQGPDGGRAAIRPATASDVDAIVALHTHVRQVCLPYLPNLHTRTEGMAYFAGLLRTSTVHIAQIGERTIAYAAHGDLWLEHLYVDPLFQRTGVGTLLLRNAMAGRDVLQLWVFRRNVAAIAFYEAFGFRLVETTDGSHNEEREPDALFEWRRLELRGAE